MGAAAVRGAGAVEPRHAEEGQGVPGLAKSARPVKNPIAAGTGRPSRRILTVACADRMAPAEVP